MSASSSSNTASYFGDATVTRAVSMANNPALTAIMTYLSQLLDEDPADSLRGCVGTANDLASLASQGTTDEHRYKPAASVVNKARKIAGSGSVMLTQQSHPQFESGVQQLVRAKGDMVYEAIDTAAKQGKTRGLDRACHDHLISRLHEMGVTDAGQRNLVIQYLLGGSMPTGDWEDAKNGASLVMSLATASKLNEFVARHKALLTQL